MVNRFLQIALSLFILGSSSYIFAASVSAKLDRSIISINESEDTYENNIKVQWQHFIQQSDIRLMAE